MQLALVANMETHLAPKLAHCGYWPRVTGTSVRGKYDNQNAKTPLGTAVDQSGAAEGSVDVTLGRECLI